MLYLLASIIFMMMLVSDRLVESDRATLSTALHTWKPWVAIGTLGGLVRLYDHFLDFAELASNRVFGIGPVRALCFVPDSRCLVAGSGFIGHMSILHERSLEILRSQTINAHADSVLDLQRYGSYLVSISDDDTLRFWGRIGPSLSLARTLPASGMCSLALQARSSTILIGCTDETLSVLEEVTGSSFQTLMLAQFKALHCWMMMEYSRGKIVAGRWRLRADSSRIIRPHGQNMGPRGAHSPTRVLGRIVSDDSSRINFVVLWRETSLVVADNYAVRCWDLDSNSPLAEDSMAMTAMPVCADPDTDILLLGTSDGERSIDAEVYCVAR
ncbi:hypothetical protein FOL47_010496, partial [Perkinsus chesapeaki]